MAGVSREFAGALQSQEENRLRRFHSRQCDDAVTTREGNSKDDHIQSVEGPFPNEPSSVGLEEIDCYPLSGRTPLGCLGCAIALIAGIAAAYSITRQMPGLPEVIFYPILALFLYVMYSVKQKFSSLVLRLDSRKLVFGPFWARQSVPFAGIRAVQILRVMHKDMASCEINNIGKFEPHRRLFFNTLKDKPPKPRTQPMLSATSSKLRL